MLRLLPRGGDELQAVLIDLLVNPVVEISIEPAHGPNANTDRGRKFLYKIVDRAAAETYTINYLWKSKNLMGHDPFPLELGG